jgi:Helix-turn-helix domain
MSFAAITWARKLPINNATTKAVLFVLAIRADDDNQCWPGIDTIAKESGAKSRIVTQTLRDLETARLIDTAQSSGGRWKSSTYRLRLDNTVVYPAQCAG